MSRRAVGRKGGLIGGLSRSPAKVAAVRENGKLGGRPRKKAKSSAELAYAPYRRLKAKG